MSKERQGDRSREGHSRGIALRLTLLAAGSLTVMSAAAISPALPKIEEHFADASGPVVSWLGSAMKALGQGEDDALVVKMLLTLPSLFIALASPFSGELLDRLGRRWVLVAGLVLFAAAGSAGLYLSSLGSLLASRAVLGVAAAAVATSGTALIGDYFTGRDRDRMLGWMSAVVGVLGLAFQLGGGGLAQLGWRWPFGLYLVALAVAPFALVMLARHAPGGDDEEADEDEADGRPPWGFWGLVSAVAFVGMTLYFVVPTQVPFFLREQLDASTIWIGVATGTAAVAGIPASVGYDRLKEAVGVRAVFAALFTLLAVGFGVMWAASGIAGGGGAAWGYWLVVGGMVPVGLAAGLLFPNLNAWVLRHTPDAHRGRGLGLMGGAMYLGQFLSPLVLQPVVSAGGVAWVFAGAGLLTAVAAAVSAGGLLGEWAGKLGRLLPSPAS